MKPVGPIGRRPIHIDVGGEGRYLHAINVNRWTTTTTTTGTPGRPIPNLVRAAGERLPFAGEAADVITVENTPIAPQTAEEIARVIRPGGRIRLLNPLDYAIGGGAHQRVINAVGPRGRVRQSISDEGIVTTLILVSPVTEKP